MSWIYHNQSQIFSRTAFDTEAYFRKKFKTHNMPQMEGWYLGVGWFLFFKRPCQAFCLINIWFSTKFKFCWNWCTYFKWRWFIIWNACLQDSELLVPYRIFYSVISWDKYKFGNLGILFLGKEIPVLNRWNWVLGKVCLRDAFQPAPTLFPCFKITFRCSSRTSSVSSYSIAVGGNVAIKSNK